MIRLSNSQARRLIDWLAVIDAILREHAVSCHDYEKAMRLNRNRPLAELWAERANDSHCAASSVRDLAAQLLVAIEPGRRNVTRIGVHQVDVGPLHRQRNNPAGGGMVAPAPPASTLARSPIALSVPGDNGAAAAVRTRELAATVDVDRAQHLDAKEPTEVQPQPRHAPHDRNWRRQSPANGKTRHTNRSAAR